MSEPIEPQDSARPETGAEPSLPSGLIVPRVQRPMCPLPEVVLLLDADGRILSPSRRYAGPRLGALAFRTGASVHEIFHPGCSGDDCPFVDDWQGAWRAHLSGLPIEWLFESSVANSCIKFRLQPVGYTCADLYGDVLRDFESCSVLFIQDMSGLEHSQQLRRSRNEETVSVFPLRRRTDPQPDIVESLDARLQSITSRLLVAQETERKRISAELHDCLGQSLSLMRYEAEALVGCQSRDRPAAETDSLARLLELSKRALGELRAIVRNLQPTVLTERGLTGALEVLCDDFRALSPDIELHRDLSGNGSLVDDQVAIAIYRILQEALNNILRHAGASRVAVTFSTGDGVARLVVTDNGCGLPAGRPLRKGLGLLSMRERADSLGGQLDIESGVGEGCSISACWPLD